MDGSDERQCDPIEIDDTIYRKILPPVLKFNKTEVEVKMNIHHIDEIDEILMKFHAELTTTLHWKDPRITFKNLAHEGNFLNKFWQNQIWLPPIGYSNAAEYWKISQNDDLTVEVQRQEKGTPNPINEIDEGKTFKGDENDLFLTALHEGYFFCSFELSEFPFDSQECSIDVHIPREIRNYIILQPKMLEYSGKYS